MKSEAKFAFKLAAHGIPNVKRIERRLFAKDSTRHKQVPGSKNIHRALQKLFSENVTLKDWDIEASGAVEVTE